MLLPREDAAGQRQLLPDIPVRHREVAVHLRAGALDVIRFRPQNGFVHDALLRLALDRSIVGSGQCTGSATVCPEDVLLRAESRFCSRQAYNAPPEIRTASCREKGYQ